VEAAVESTIPIVKEYILQTFLQGEDPQNLAPDTELIRSGVLDSLATLDLVAFLEQRFDIELAAHDVDASNLGTLDDIDRLVQSKRAAGA
jgi:acyl carrier protein